MSTAAVTLVWLVPLLLGSGVWLAMTGWPRRAGGLAISMGGGWIVGALMCGLLMRSLAASDLSTGLVRAGTSASAIGIAGWILAWLARERGGVEPRSAPMTRLELVLLALLLAGLGWRGWLLASDIALHPVLAWDAWAVWAAKAKAWVLAGHASPYVPFDQWLRQSGDDLRTASAWSYPELLPWTLTWFATHAGWIEPWINMAWLGLWASLLTVHYGQWRRLGVSRVHSLAGVYMLGSLPLLDAHVALGGYADLWVAALMSMAAHAWLHWRETSEHRQLLVVAGVVLLLPMLKLEGAVWSIVLVAAAVFGALPRRMRSQRFVIGAAVAAIAIALCITLSVPWVEVARRYAQDSIVIEGSRIGSSLYALANALWGQWNWNLLWFALPAALYWRRAQWSRSTTVRSMLALVAVPLLLLIGLFVLTAAARYAQSYSAVNRLLLQLTPMLVSLLVLVLWLPTDQSAERAAAGDDAAA